MSLSTQDLVASWLEANLEQLNSTKEFGVAAIALIDLIEKEVVSRLSTPEERWPTRVSPVEMAEEKLKAARTTINAKAVENQVLRLMFWELQNRFITYVEEHRPEEECR